jgi:hypothetical protein
MSKSYNKFGFYFIFLLSPILSYILAITNYANRGAKNILVLFSGFVGYTLQIPKNSTFDAAVYRDSFLNNFENKTSLLDLWELLFKNRNHYEFVEKVLSVSVSSFTNNYHVLFGIYGLFFGYFLSRNLAYVYNKSGVVNRKGSVFLTVAVTFVIPFWSISGFDFWVASQVFVFAGLPIVYAGKYNRFFILLLTPFIHISYFVALILIVPFWLLRKKENLILTIYLFSFFSFLLSKGIFEQFIPYMPNFIASKASVYIEGLDRDIAGGFIVGLVRSVYFFSSNILFFFIYKENKLFISRAPKLNRIFFFTFYWCAIFNLLSIIPSVGRFLYVGNIFMLLSLFLLLNHKSFKNVIIFKTYLSKVKLIFISFWVIITVRYYFPMLGVGSFLSNPILVGYFINDDLIIGNVLDFL